MEIKNKPYRLTSLARIVAYKLYVLHINDDEREKIDVTTALSLFTIPMSRNLIRSALELLRSDQFVARSGDGQSKPTNTAFFPRA